MIEVDNELYYDVATWTKFTTFDGNKSYNWLTLNDWDEGNGYEVVGWVLLDDTKGNAK